MSHPKERHSLGNELARAAQWQVFKFRSGDTGVTGNQFEAMALPVPLDRQSCALSPVEQQVLCNRVAHALATNDGLSLGLPGPIHLSLMLQTFSPRNVTYH